MAIPITVYTYRLESGGTDRVVMYTDIRHYRYGQQDQHTVDGFIE
jgi:hypothetical protein